MTFERYDAIVVGAGPGGATAATVMARDNLRVLLIDKESFPRDKICGDAISGKSVDVLRELGMLDDLVRDESLGSWGVTFSGPMGDEVSIPFTKMLDQPVAPGFVSRREVFDQLVFQKAVDAGATVLQNTTVKGLLFDDGRVTGVRARLEDNSEVEIESSVVVGADGAYSVVARELGMEQLDEKHYCAGLRSYYKGVTGFDERNHIELHFVDESIPGYFWIFPMPNGMSNVGVGMLSSVVKKRSVQLKPLLETLVNHPRFSHRFANAERVGNVKGWGLPLGSKPREMAGDGWVLIGDAASLIDPFTGEGIGNAMVSGWKAADWIAKAKEADDFSGDFLRQFETEVMARLKNELKLSHAMQKLGNWKWLLNTVIKKASRSDELADAISCMFDDLDERRKLVSPTFYFRVLTA
ncbi:MAG: geranylgeranyl reductase family protein [Rhodothermales bacterium]|nr:geranylgeranyl reductase family protein [Rhodothermales bacterium]